MVRNKHLLAIMLDLHEEMLTIREKLADLDCKVSELKMTKREPGRPKKQK